MSVATSYNHTHPNRSPHVPTGGTQKGNSSSQTTSRMNSETVETICKFSTEKFNTQGTLNTILLSAAFIEKYSFVTLAALKFDYV